MTVCFERIEFYVTYRLNTLKIILLADRQWDYYERHCLGLYAPKRTWHTFSILFKYYVVCSTRT